jgi:paraquat-inducible protein A
MCDHHHAARHILCPQCDLLVALPQLEHRQKAVCPRCGTTLTTVGRAPAASHSLCAGGVVYAAAGQPVPFVYMKVSGLSEIKLLEIPDVLFSEDYASLGTFFYSLYSWCRLFVWSPFCCWSTVFICRAR